MVPDPDAWDPWGPRLIADRLADVDMPWYVAGGWAIDLLRGAPTREHEDIEIAVPAERFSEVATRFPECDFYVAGGGRRVPVSPEALRAHHQTWAWERRAGVWRFDVFREPHEGGTWIYRRDPRIRRRERRRTACSSSARRSVRRSSARAPIRRYGRRRRR